MAEGDFSGGIALPPRVAPRHRATNPIAVAGIKYYFLAGFSASPARPPVHFFKATSENQTGAVSFPIEKLPPRHAWRHATPNGEKKTMISFPPGKMKDERCAYA
jgi:hypothetical protein